jgi:hypothetical protein
VLVVEGVARGVDVGDDPVSRDREERPVPGMPEFRMAPRLPMPTDAPRGPIVQLEPEPEMFHRIPGASLIDFLNLSATFWSLQNGRSAVSMRVRTSVPEPEPRL